MDIQRCKTCGGVLGDTGEGDVCPSCALRGIISVDPLVDETEETPRSTPPTLPRKFGAYELLEELGRGGMGVVYRARQTNLDREVAVKLLLAGAHAGELALKRFQTEASAAAGLHHPAIVAIHDYGEVDGQPYYAMDLIEGQNLAELCGGRPLEPRQAAEMVRTLASAVQHAHERGVLHRDLKPSNVIIAPGGQPYVADFGLAKLYSEGGFETLSGQAMGSPGYLAPEQARADSEAIGVQTDVYGLGALFYYLLTGRAPFNAATTAETFSMVIAGSPPSPRVLNPGVPRDVEIICFKCLETEPERRYLAAAELGEDLDRFLKGKPIRARAPNKLYLALKYARRHRNGVAVGGAATVALVAGLTGIGVGIRRESEKRFSERARELSQEMIGDILIDLQPRLEAGGEWQVTEAYAESVVLYYEELPPNLYDEQAKRAHAIALERWGDASNAMSPMYTEHNRPAFEKAAILWAEIAEEKPDDVDAATAALRNRFRVLCWLETTTSNPDGLVQNGALVEDYRALDRRFPNHPMVRAGLGRALAQRCEMYAGQGDESGMYTCAAEVEQLFSNLLAAHPEKPWLILQSIRANHIVCFGFNRIHLRDQSMHYGRKTLALLESALERDPGNAVLMADLIWALYWMVRQAHPGEIDELIDLACPMLAELIKYHPNEPTWRMLNAEMLSHRADELVADRQLDGALDLYKAALGEMEHMPNSTQKMGMLGRLISISGALAAKQGDRTAAQTCLSRLTEEMAPWTNDSGATDDPSIQRLRHWIRQLMIAESLSDWTRTEELARNMVEEIVRNPERHVPEKRNGFRPIAHATLGRALLKQGVRDEAFEHYEVAAEVLLSRYGVGLKEPGFQDSDYWQAVEDFVDLLSERGDTQRAIDTLERLLARIEDHVAVGGRLMSRVAAARCSWKLARVLETGDVDSIRRQRELLGRAVELLDAPETSPRLLPEEREMRAEIGKALDLSVAITAARGRT